MVRAANRGQALRTVSSDSAPQGYLALVLHAHLPFVHHPEHEHFLEEHWLFEALTETYLPLLALFERLHDEGLPFGVTLSISPPLMTMLGDDLLRSRYDRHLELHRRLIDSELRRTSQLEGGHLRYLAGHYRDQLDEVLDTWQRLGGDLVSAFGRLQELGHLDILTSGATHGYLPLMQIQPEAVWAQIKVAVDHYRRRFGRQPTGIWLPECGYYQGIDRLLAHSGLRYFVADTHGVLWADPKPHAASFAPIYAPRSGVAAFARDLESSIEVWSRERGYPGDYIYREFYRDIGHDHDLELIGEFLRPEGIRRDTGIKYHRITGPVQHKELYDPYHGRAKALEHADDFIDKRLAQVGAVGRLDFDRPPLVVSPYDAELFGHWWYEGPWWIEQVLRRAAAEQREGRLATTHLRGYLQRHRVHQLAQPAQSSWGERGYHEYWLNETNHWLYPPLHEAARRMVDLATRGTATSGGGLDRRARAQAARELLLAQASDWAFIMRAQTSVEYAEQRTRAHLRRFFELHRQLEAGRIDGEWLGRVELIDNIFPEIDYRVYASAPEARRD